MKTELVVEHTVACLPKSSGMVLDVGCRAFDFSKAMVNKGYKVVSVEADKEVQNPNYDGIHFVSNALVSESQNNQSLSLVKFGNGTANHLANLPGGFPKGHRLDNIIGLSISHVSKMMNVSQWDVVKLDCEGAEYSILLEWPGSIACQITVEFHEHTGANLKGKDVYEDILNHLGQWYVPIQHQLSCRHGIKKPNYWDSLFILKEFLP